MAEDSPRDTAFEVAFFESVMRHDAQCVEVVEILGGLYTKMGRISDGLRMDRKLVRLRNSDALRSLKHAVGLGYRDFEWMTHDPDLQGLKRIPEFGAIVDQLKPQS
jgi:hypothetical protein